MIPKKPVSFIKDAIFLSHTTLSDFLKCPRAYYFKNVYRNPKTGYKIQIASPFLALGSSVHDTAKWYLESSDQPSLLQTEEHFRNFWWKYHGKRGGFTCREEEAAFGQRGLKMVENFTANICHLGRFLPLPRFPKYPLFENVVLHGNMDCVEELPDKSLHVIDFKTGSKDEDDADQLYIYTILAENHYGREVSKASFWYLDRDDAPRQIVLDDLSKKIDWLLIKGQEIKKALANNAWDCIGGASPCPECRDYRSILEGRGELVFRDDLFKKEVYFLPRKSASV